jgi:diguanylate cyclase (GGDEF)-like protein
LYQTTYAYLNILCVAILAFILFRMMRSAYLSDARRTLSRVVANLIVVLAMSAVAILASGNNLPLSLFANSTFLFWTGVTGLSWLRYTEATLDREERPRIQRLVEALPVMLLAIACYASVWTGWVFTVDPVTIAYHRGPLHFLQTTFAGFYLVASAALTLRAFVRETSPQRRRELLTLLAFFILPALGTILDIFVYGIPFTWTLCTVAVVMVFSNFQEYSISTDGLTGLNNRRQFESRACAMVEDATPSSPVFLLLMDVDGFKSINDFYGHRAGDAALVQVADLLKEVADNRHVVISRYGGDEFAFLGNLPSRAEAEKLKREVVETFERHDRESKAPYHLRLSIGIAQAGTGAAQTVDELVNAADRELYAEKATHLAGSRGRSRG